MNYLLRFRSQAHSKTFSSTHLLQLDSRFYLGLAVNGGFLPILIGDILSHTTANSNLLKAWDYTRLALLLIWVLTMLGLYVKRISRPSKASKLIFWALDLLMILFSASDLFWVVVQQKTTGIENGTSSAGDRLTGWSSGVLFSCSLFLIHSWHLRIVSCLAKFLLFSILALIQNDISNWTVGLLAIAAAVQGYTVYNREKFERTQFLERVKTFEDSEAVKNILDDITEGILIVDKENRILYTNKPVEKIFMTNEISLEYLFSRIAIKSVSSTCSELTDSTNKKLFQIYDKISNFLLQLETHQKEVITIEGVTTFQEARSNRNYVVKFAHSTYNEKRVIVANISDTTDRDSVLSLRNNNEYKTRLLASVSHELRTPLNGSLNFTEEALNDPSVPQSIKQKLLLPAFRSNRMLLSLINDILDFSQIQENKLRLVFERKNIVQTVTECAELLEIQAGKKGLDLKVESLIQSSNQFVLTDHNRVKQILLNLLSNAVKFTFEGTIVLCLQHTTLAGRRAIRFECKDTGIGITAENQKKLFHAFEKIDLGENIAINSTGVGLGLVISNNLAQRINQGVPQGEQTSINFESKSGQGSTFWFDVVDQTENQSSLTAKHYLSKSNAVVSFSADVMNERGVGESPLTIKNHRTVTVSTHSVTDKSNTETDNAGVPLTDIKMATEAQSLLLSDVNITIKEKCICPPALIVDDDVFNITALEQHLSKLKIKCDQAFNGKQAIEKIMKRQSNRCCRLCSQYKVMFLDCNMPVMDGFQTAKELRLKISRHEIDVMKIIACTAFVQQAEIDLALSAGMDDYCTKPVTVMVIQEKLKGLIL